MHNMHICKHTHTHICVCVFRDDHLLLENHSLYSSLEKTISSSIIIPEWYLKLFAWSYLCMVEASWVFPFDFDISVGFRFQFMFGQSCYWDCVDIASDITRKFPDSLTLTTFPLPLPQRSLSLKCTSVFPMYPQGLCSTPLHFD